MLPGWQASDAGVGGVARGAGLFPPGCRTGTAARRVVRHPGRRGGATGTKIPLEQATRTPRLVLASRRGSHAVAAPYQGGLGGGQGPASGLGVEAGGLASG